MDSPAELREAEEEKRPNIPVRLNRHVQRKMLAGLLDLFALLATIMVLLFLIRQADGLIRPLFLVSGRPWDVAGIGVVVFAVIFYFVGLLVSFSFGRGLMDLLRTVFMRVPVVGAIFGVTQQISTAMTSQYDFSRVVFLEWPRENMLAVGFVTGRVLTEDKSRSIVVVYIPTVPNPTSGNMAFVNEDDVVETDISVDAAMKLIFAGGIVLPPAMSLARVPRHERDDSRGLIGRFETER